MILPQAAFGLAMMIMLLRGFFKAIPSDLEAAAVLDSQTRFTLPLGVMDFMGEHAADWNNLLAFLTLAMVPAVLIYVFCQKYIVAGLAASAIKG